MFKDLFGILSEGVGYANSTSQAPTPIFYIPNIGLHWKKIRYKVMVGVEFSYL